MSTSREHIVAAEHPELYAALGETKRAIEPIVAALGHIASFDGAVLFIRDNRYKDSAASVASINARARGVDRFNFQTQHITGRRVDLLSSAVGDTFRTKTREFAPSKMNPKHHVVLGMPVSTLEDDAVFQLAFSPHYGVVPEQETVERVWMPHSDLISDSVETLLNQASGQTSLSDELLLNVPTTPNAYVMNWDLTGSSRIAANNYPVLRHYLTHASELFTETTARAHGELLTSSGDGQSFRFELPYPAIDRNNEAAVGEYGANTVLPISKQIFRAHNELARRYTPEIGPIRIGIELGCYEPTTLGDSSPSLWSIASDMEALPRDQNALSIGPIAKRAIELYRLLEKKV